MVAFGDRDWVGPDRACWGPADVLFSVSILGVILWLFIRLPTYDTRTFFSYRMSYFSKRLRRHKRQCRREAEGVLFSVMCTLEFSLEH